jgi:hypothetical protein
MTIAKSGLLKSLNNESSKIWPCTKRIRVNDKSQVLPLGVTDPKLIIESTKEWSGLYRAREDAWLDVKGAFFGKNEPYQVKTVKEREESLHENGEA